MKNFKKVIAFLMVAAMTLGMGLTAFADGETSGPFKVVTELDGNVLKFSVVTTEQIDMMAGGFLTSPDDAKVATDLETVKAVAADYGYYSAEFEAWQIKGSSLKHLDVTNYIAEDKQLVFYPATTTRPESRLAEGTTVFGFALQLKDGVKAGDVVATIKLDSVTVFVSNTESQKLELADLQVVVPEADEPAPGPDDSSSSDASNSSSSDDASQPSSSDDASKPSGSDATTPSGSDNASKPADDTTAKSDANTPATTKGIATKDDALNALDTLAKALAVKLDKNSFANDADYQAYVTALENAKKAKSDAEKAAALKALKDAMSKAKDDVLVAAVKTVVNTTTAPNSTTAPKKNSKTGDSAPIAVLMVVAIAAFGTAVVVYRKKVNA